MTKCPECGRRLKKEKRELSAGMYAQVEICPDCCDEWIDEEEYEALRSLFRRRAFRAGGSLAVRLPKEITEVVGLEDGEELSISMRGGKIIIEKTSA
jgi:hypothetical protein